MSHFILQKEEGIDKDLEIVILEDLLKHNRLVHDYEFQSINYFKNGDVKQVIPVGTINFVREYLKNVHNVIEMNPIEVPICLRTKEFLKREYNILQYNDIPKEGRYFIKDVSELKSFSYLGDLEELKDGELNKEHLYQVSEEIKIKSEYRIYFIDGELQAVSNYNGSPWILPDMGLINKANLIYSMQHDYPRSYTMDVAITDKGTCILEIHPFVSVGLYNTLWGSNLLYAYRDGIEYYLYKNTKIV